MVAQVVQRLLAGPVTVTKWWAEVGWFKSELSLKPVVELDLKCYLASAIT
jgi:hypothetical protein